MSKLSSICYRTGSWASIVTALMHFAGYLSGPAKPENETESKLVDLMTTYGFTLPGAPHRTMMEFFNGFSLTFSLFLALTGAVGLMIIHHEASAPSLTRTTAIAFAGSYGILFGISLRYFFLVPTVCIGICFFAFALSLLFGRMPQTGTTQETHSTP